MTPQQQAEQAATVARMAVEADRSKQRLKKRYLMIARVRAQTAWVAATDPLRCLEEAAMIEVRLRGWMWGGGG
jgi:hypothetical protein